tara:strand:- start:46 stop:402 length:357 start_codon:yes stop_codon:yes gene_type:complete
MAHFAELNEQNNVLRVLVINNDVITVDGEEKEEVGADFLTNLCGGQWKQTSYNNNFRKNYAGQGYTYDQTRDAFIAQKPYPSWILNESTCHWNAPTPYPDDGKRYDWDEDTTSWKEIE